MTTSARPRRTRATLAISIAALALAPAVAHAAAPATVTVRVEGLHGTVLPQTQVTTTTAPVLPDGKDACSPTSAGGALWDATGGHWSGAFGAYGYEIDDIAGTSLPPFSSNPDAYWSFWINGQAAQLGACGQELHPGDDLVFFEQCSAVGPDCTSATAPDHFLIMGRPGTATPSVGQALTLPVSSQRTAYPGGPEPAPTGTTVVSTAGPSAVSAAVSGGQATVTFSRAGTYTLQAQASDAVPSDPVTVCVHAGNDGSCGTTAAPAGPAPSGPAASPQVTTTTSSTAAAPTVGVLPAQTRVTAFAATLGSPRNDAVYRFGHAPRTITGHVTAPDRIDEVALRLTRRGAHGRCAYFDGTRERFRRMRCGAAHGRWFSVASGATFSYLLPSQLAPGRYVLDLQARDGAGKLTTLRHGTTRVVFYVRGGRRHGHHRRHATVAAVPAVQLMVVSPRGTLFGPRSVAAGPVTVSVGRRRCAVAGGTALAALEHAGGIHITLHDYGHCTMRAADGGQLFVAAIDQYAGHGATGWEYKVDDRAGTTGAGDPSGPLGDGHTLHSGQRVLWFLCTLRHGSCQRSLRMVAPRSVRRGGRLRVTVLAYDDQGHGRPVRGALVTLGRQGARTDAHGHATLTAPRRGAAATLYAGATATVPAFPQTIALR